MANQSARTIWIILYCIIITTFSIAAADRMADEYFVYTKLNREAPL